MDPHDVIAITFLFFAALFEIGYRLSLRNGAADGSVSRETRPAPSPTLQ